MQPFELSLVECSKGMKLVALVSGGKDSVLGMMEAVKRGHEIRCIANLRPPPSDEPRPAEGDDGEELDSHCFQTCGYRAVDHIAVCMGVPLRTRAIHGGQSIQVDLLYTKEGGSAGVAVDEVEEMFMLLKDIKEEFPDVGGVCSGAILSTYQRLRVEDVCRRLGLVSYSPLWQVAGAKVLEMVRDGHVDARLIKTASMGLNPRRHLGRSLADEDVADLLLDLEERYQIHPAGEGGEFESIVLDCPLFLEQRLAIVNSHIILVDDNPIAPMGRLSFDTEIVSKSPEEMAAAKDWNGAPGALIPEFQTAPPALSLSTLTESVLASLSTIEGSGDVNSEHIEDFISRAAVPCKSPEEAANAVRIALNGAAATSSLVRVVVQCHVAGLSPPNQMSMLLRGLCQGSVASTPLFIQIFASCMSTYKAVNVAYEGEIAAHTIPGYAKGTYPARAFVARGLHADGPLAISATFHREALAVTTLRVESTSLWAAAAIGPYSQGIVFSTPVPAGAIDEDELPPSQPSIIISGRIGMLPSTLDVISPQGARTTDHFASEFCATFLNVVTGLATLMPRSSRSGVWGATLSEAAEALLAGGTTPATVFVADISYSKYVLPAWQALAGAAGIHDPTKVRPLTVRVAPQLPKGAIVEIVSFLPPTNEAPLL